MITTPKKKRTASVSVSPLKKDEDKLNNKGNSKKPSKQYHFAPLNRLNKDEAILRSIPISKVRNVDSEKKLA